MAQRKKREQTWWARVDAHISGKYIVLGTNKQNLITVHSTGRVDRGPFEKLLGRKLVQDEKICFKLVEVK